MAWAHANALITANDTTQVAAATARINREHDAALLLEMINPTSTLREHAETNQAARRAQPSPRQTLTKGTTGRRTQ